MLKKYCSLMIAVFAIGGCQGSSLDPGELLADQYPGLRSYYCPIKNSKYGIREEQGWDADSISQDINDLVKDSPVRSEVERQRIVDEGMNNIRLFCVEEPYVTNELGEKATVGFVHYPAHVGMPWTVELAIVDPETGNIETWLSGKQRWELAKIATAVATGNLDVVYSNKDWQCAASNCR